MPGANETDKIDAEAKVAERRFELARDQWKFEVERFWQRSIFFWGFITSALAAFGIATQVSDRLEFAAACFGCLTSLAWSLQNRAGKFWQESWEEKINEAKGSTVPPDFLVPSENVRNSDRWLSARRYSPSRLTIALSNIVSMSWFGLIVYASRPGFGHELDLVKLTVACFALAGSLLLLVGARSSR